MRFVIADDVYYARAAVEKMVLEWDAQSQILALAESGDEAIAALEANTVDVLISDIKMPGANGLALAQLVQQKWPHIKIILVTGYALFEYARDAMMSGVARYLLKPLKKEELVDALNAVRAQLGDAQTQQDTVAKIQRMAAGFRLAQALAGNEEVDIALLPVAQDELEKGFSILLVHAQGAQRGALCAAVDAQNEPNALAFEEALQTESVIILLLNQTIAAKTEQINKILKAIGEVCPQAVAAQSNIFHEAQQLRTAYRQARRALCLRLVRIGEAYFTFDDTPIVRPLLSTESLRMVQSKLRTQHTEEAVAILQRCLSEKGVTLLQLEGFYRDMLGICYALCSELGNVQSEYLLQRRLWDFNQQDAMLAYLCALSGTDEKAAQPINEGDLIEEIKQFLEENYFCEISLTELATTRYFMNADYLSRLFKARTGIGFAKYLLQLRMNKAKILLEQGHMTIGEVAGMVGYISTSNFIQNFKKTFGETPGKAKGEH